MMKRYLWPVVAFALLLLGLTLGFFVGRVLLERQWSRPVSIVSAKAYERSAQAGADPTPPVGTRIFAALPLGRLREAAARELRDLPLKVTLTSFGNGEDGTSLHLMMKNDAACAIVAYDGIAFAYDAYGRASKANLAGENYVLFASTALEKKPKIDPGGKLVHEQKLRYPETASIGLAYVEHYTCADGTQWKRP
jgi:hypothetical protein